MRKIAVVSAWKRLWLAKILLFFFVIYSPFYFKFKFGACSLVHVYFLKFYDIYFKTFYLYFSLIQLFEILAAHLSIMAFKQWDQNQNEQRCSLLTDAVQSYLYFYLKEKSQLSSQLLSFYHGTQTGLPHFNNQ